MVSKPSKQWSPLEDAKWFIEELKKGVSDCNATGMASRAAGAQGYIEAAFYSKEIDEDKMQEMKDEISTLISNFNDNCSCIKNTSVEGRTRR